MFVVCGLFCASLNFENNQMTSHMSNIWKVFYRCVVSRVPSA